MSTEIKIATNPEVYDILSPKYLGLTTNLLYANDNIPIRTNIDHGIPKNVAYRYLKSWLNK